MRLLNLFQWTKGRTIAASLKSPDKSIVISGKLQSYATATTRRPPKVPEITNRLAALVEIEQYHQMCARTQIILKVTGLTERAFAAEISESAGPQCQAFEVCPPRI
jgi:hypothetical protein